MSTIGSLFSGIGGLELGLERSGLGRVVWQVEADPFCREVLARHWPSAERFDDVKGLEPPRADIICGGFPCQGFSLQGRGRGMSDERSGLWSEFARIIGALRPRVVVLENVPNIRSKGFGAVLCDFYTRGYDVEWDCFPASAFGAAMRRDRLFAVAYTHGRRRKAGARVFDRITEKDRAWPAKHEQLAGVGSGRVRRVPYSDICRVADGVPDRVDRYRALGNAVSPIVSEYVGRCINRFMAEGAVL